MFLPVACAVDVFAVAGARQEEEKKDFLNFKIKKKKLALKQRYNETKQLL